MAERVVIISGSIAGLGAAIGWSVPGSARQPELETVATPSATSGRMPREGHRHRPLARGTAGSR